MILLILICSSPGTLWLDARAESNWANEYAFQLQGSQVAVSSFGTLPDPMLQFSFAGSPVETRNGPLLGSIGLQQKIPWPGLLSSSERKAELDYSVAEEMKYLLDLQMRTGISLVWAEAYKRQQREILSTTRAVYLVSLLESAIGASPTMALEQSALADLRVRTALSTQKPFLEHNLFVSALGELDALTGTGTGAIDFEGLPSKDWFLERISLAAVDPPSLRIARGAVEVAEAELSRMNSLGMPDFTVGGSYSPVGSAEGFPGAETSGRDSWMISLGMTVPLGYSGNSERIESAEFYLAAAREHYLQLDREAQAELNSLAALIQNCADELGLLSEMLPVAESALSSASQSWVSGRGSYSTLVSTLENSLDIQMNIVDKEALLVITTARWLELAGAITEEGEFL